MGDRRGAVEFADVLPEGLGRIARRQSDPVVTPVWSMNCPDRAIRRSEELFQCANDHGTGRGRVSSRPHHGFELFRHIPRQSRHERADPLRRS